VAELTNLMGSEFFGVSSIQHNYFPPSAEPDAPWSLNCVRSLGRARVIKYGDTTDIDIVVTQPRSTCVTYERLDEEQERARSLLRARRKLVDAVRCLRANRILTLTSEECITDRDIFLWCVRKFVRLMKQRHKEWKCVYALELQKRGAWHAHLAVVGMQYADEASALWASILEEERKGQYHLGGILTGKRAAGYISKYIGKDLPEGERPRYGHHYGRSRGLTPESEIYNLINSTIGDLEAWALATFDSLGLKVQTFSRRCSKAPYWLYSTTFRC